jgi:hypothetical protein
MAEEMQQTAVDYQLIDIGLDVDLYLRIIYSSVV